MKKFSTILIWSVAGAAFMAGAVFLIDGFGTLIMFLLNRFGPFGTTVITAGAIGAIMGANAGMKYSTRTRGQAQ